MAQIEALLGFLVAAVTPFHAVAAMSRRYRDAGFEEVEQFDPSAMTAGRGYCMTRQSSSLIAMRAGQGRPEAGLRLLAERAEVAEVDAQSFVMRADLTCGSTIGPITATEMGIATTDLSVPTLAMHSIRELACKADIPQLVSLLTAFCRRLA